MPPDRIGAVLRGLDRYGLLGAATLITAARDRERPALIDERGALSFGDLDSRTNALANEWRRLGLGPGANVAILARNEGGKILKRELSRSVGQSAASGESAPQVPGIIGIRGPLP
ncbi:hypothetical protein GCM10009641_05190 [Mycobacterium cookii]|uniref:AMP-dependent synthetase/ligase domain-containing protein n=2 Tax=Mycobacterium cookii TaxID=1775 RepID=A0A7I7L250_9MYCO|nr:hypothetical protein MCOO_44500 [Mycobacterium cookii]